MTPERAGLPRSELLSVARGAGIVFGGTLVGSGLKYAFQVLVARSLGADLFGLFVLGLTVFTIAEIIAQLGLPQGLVRYVSLFQARHDRERLKGVILFSARTVIVSGAVMGLGLFLGSNILSLRIFGQPGLGPVLRIFAVMTPFSVLGTILLFTFQGFKVLEYKMYVGEFLEPLLRIAGVLIVFFAWGKALVGVLWAYGFAAVAALLQAVFLLKKICPDVFLKAVRPIIEARRLLSFSWPLLFTGLIGQVLLVADTIILGILKAPEEVGIYGAAQRTGLLANMIFVSFNTIFAPIVADLYHREDHQDLAHLFKIVSKWAFAVTLPASLVMMLLARPILFLFGERFVQAAVPLVVLAGGWLIHSLLGNAGAVLTMSGRSKLHLANFLLLLASVIVSNALLIPRYGIMGAALGTAGSLIFVDILTCLQVYVIMGLHPFRPDEVKPVMAGCVSLGVTWLLRARAFPDYRNLLNLVILGGVCLLVYALAFYALRISQEEKLVLGRIWQRLRKSE